MGMYTELFICVRLEPNKQVIDTLSHMLGLLEDYEISLKHPLFNHNNSHLFMLRCASYYFVPTTVNTLEYDNISRKWCFISRSDFKNYNNEIALFIDWIMPYTYGDIGNMLGYYRYEENKEPTIIYKV